MPVILSPGPMRIVPDRETWEQRAAESLCPLCRQPVSEEDSCPNRPDTHDECYGQQLGEELLAASIERVADELAEEVADYVRQRHAPAESERTRIVVELLRGCVKVMRQVIAPPPLTVCQCGADMPTLAEIADGRCIACQRRAAQAEAQWDESRGH